MSVSRLMESTILHRTHGEPKSPEWWECLDAALGYLAICGPVRQNERVQVREVVRLPKKIRTQEQAIPLQQMASCGQRLRREERRELYLRETGRKE